MERRTDMFKLIKGFRRSYIISKKEMRSLKTLKGKAHGITLVKSLESCRPMMDARCKEYVKNILTRSSEKNSCCLPFKYINLYGEPYNTITLHV
jgi:hypothetical protein